MRGPAVVAVCAPDADRAVNGSAFVVLNVSTYVDPSGLVSTVNKAGRDEPAPLTSLHSRCVHRRAPCYADGDILRRVVREPALQQPDVCCALGTLAAHRVAHRSPPCRLCQMAVGEIQSTHFVVPASVGRLRRRERHSRHTGARRAARWPSSSAATTATRHMWPSPTWRRSRTSGSASRVLPALRADTAPQRAYPMYGNFMGAVSFDLNASVGRCGPAPAR